MVRPFNIIVACSENRIIGREGRLPWRIPEDWQYFRKTTTGATVVLGRISFESWRSVLDDDRNAIVLTRNDSLARDRVQVTRSLQQALELASASPRPIFVCGGQRIFEEAMVHPEAQRLYLTQVHAHVEGDRSFPDWRNVFTKSISSRDGADENYRYTFSVLEREADPCNRTAKDAKLREGKSDQREPPPNGGKRLQPAGYSFPLGTFA